jgi:hypothetical protein
MAKKKAKREPIRDPVMDKVKTAYEASRLNSQQLGEKMGYAPEIARKAVFQFLKSVDPRVGTVRRFAKAMKLKITDLIK